MKRADQPDLSLSQRPAHAAIVRELAQTASIEVTPGQILGMSELPDWLPGGTAVYVPFLPNARYADTVFACQRLRGVGLEPIPHFPARAVTSRDQARDWLGELAAVGTDRLMLIAGDNEHTAGPFPDTLALLDSGLLAEYGFYNLGVAGHPEGHPFASRDELGHALAIKRDYASATATRMWVVTQFAFKAETFTRWLHATTDVVNPLPVYFGIVGPTRLRTLIAYAAHCGVSVSAQVLRRKPATARLLRAWLPDELVSDLARHRLDNPASLFRGIHLYSFGGLRRSSEWLCSLREERGHHTQLSDREVESATSR